MLEVHNHKLKSKKDFPKGIKFVTEHAQVRNALKYYGSEYLSEYLTNLAKLRNKADYYPYDEITSTELHDAIGYMEAIFQGLKFK